jgi:hypothetical protein
MYHNARLSYSLYFSDGSMQGFPPLMTILCEFFLVIGGRGTVNLTIISFILILLIHLIEHHMHRAIPASQDAVTRLLHILPSCLFGIIDKMDSVTFADAFAHYPNGIVLSIVRTLNILGCC